MALEAFFLPPSLLPSSPCPSKHVRLAGWRHRSGYTHTVVCTKAPRQRMRRGVVNAHLVSLQREDCGLQEDEARLSRSHGGLSSGPLVSSCHGASKASQVRNKHVSSVQFSRSVVSDSLRPHELQHARPPCPSPTPGV